jgi:hypothetical protein
MIPTGGIANIHLAEYQHRKDTRRTEMSELKPCRHTWRETIIHTGRLQDSKGFWNEHTVSIEFCPECGKIRNRRTT